MALHSTAPRRSGPRLPKIRSIVNKTATRPKKAAQGWTREASIVHRRPRRREPGVGIEGSVRELPLMSETVDLHDSFGKGLRGFLRQVVPYAAPDQPVRILAREFLGIGARVGVWRAVGIAFKGNSGHGNERTFGKPLLQ